MSDLISRQAVITEFNCCELTPDGGIDANYAIEFLEQLPAASPEPRWIRSSERLPELSERVLVCDGEYVSMSMLGRGYNGSYIWLFDTFWNDLEDLPYWMPLPKPPMKEGD